MKDAPLHNYTSRPRLKGEKPRGTWALGDFAVVPRLDIWPYLACAKITALAKSPNGPVMVEGFPAALQPIAVIDDDAAANFQTSLDTTVATFRKINRAADQLINETEISFLKAVSDA